MDKEMKEALSNIQCQISEINKKLEESILTGNNGNYTYTSDPPSDEDEDEM